MECDDCVFWIFCERDDLLHCKENDGEEENNERKDFIYNLE